MKHAQTRLLLAIPLWLLGLACEASGVARPTAGAREGSTPPSAEIANRDPKGPRDVGDYIARLTSPARLAEMRPDEVIEVLALQPDDWIADVGCGPGVFALRMARVVPAGVVFAVDIEPAQLDRLREGVAAEQLENVVPVLASPDAAHLPRGRFDWLFMADTFHHLGNRVEYMRGLRRALAPGGKLAMFEYKPGDLPVGPPADHKLPPGQMERELEAAGWVMETDVASHKYHDFQVWVPRAE